MMSNAIDGFVCGDYFVPCSPPPPSAARHHQRGAKFAGCDREDLRLFLQPIDSGRIQFQLPRRWIVVAVRADGFRDVVVIELADPGRKISGLSKRLGQADVVRNRLPENLGVG